MLDKLHNSTEEFLGPVDPTELLSPRQLEIIRLVSSGLPNKEIANRLGLTDGTVKQHLAAIFRKLGVTNRTWAATLWRQIAGEPADANPAPHEPILSCADVARRPPPSISQLPGRLVAVVTVILSNFATGASSLQPQQANPVESVIACCGDWAELFEGSFEISATGAVSVVFGFPVGHIDDLERARSFARIVHRHLAGNLGLDVRVAVDAGLDGLTVSDNKLAACAAAAGSLRAAMTKQSDDIILTERAENLLEASRAVTVSLATKLAKSPIVAHATRTLQSRRASWLSVEAWPPLSGRCLLDAWTETTIPPRARKLVLRLPVNAEILPTVEQRLVAQIIAQALDFRPSAYPSAGLGWWLGQLAQDGPLMVIVHGAADLKLFRAVIGDAKLAELAALPILFVVGPVPVPGAARLSMRILGPTGEIPLVSRAHEVSSKELEEYLEQSWCDIDALVDQADPTDKFVIAALLRYRRCTGQFLASQLQIVPAQLEGSLSRLSQLGLASISSDQSVRVRDDRTAYALTKYFGL